VFDPVAEMERGEVTIIFGTSGKNSRCKLKCVFNRWVGYLNLKCSEKGPIIEASTTYKGGGRLVRSSLKVTSVHMTLLFVLFLSFVPSAFGSAFGGVTTLNPAMCKFYPVELKGRPSAEI